VCSLEPVSHRHEAAVLAFERSNRQYFARSVNDRGDAYFRSFSDGYRGLLAEQEMGTGAFYVLVDDDGAVVARFNLYGIADGAATAGYRVAEKASGQGVATSGLRQLCRVAAEDIGLRRLLAAADADNLASQRVLAKAGFVVVGPTTVAGRPGSEFLLDLAADRTGGR
jgi:ribosomal-protein-alanine N-acetyltransferase